MPKTATIPRDLSTVASLPKSASGSQKPSEEDFSHIEPDDLFVRFTIPEIKAIHSKLRADADAKQEELRLMVGERYRDLLQASTSIISLSESSRRVMDALTEMQEYVTSEEPQRKRRSSSIRGKDDAHLKVLQSLSAHMKLLLDAPEHLWRLLEKKQYLQAAWLFLLARVVHRALVTEDPEEGSWVSEGINVLAQFPLVQRQWDTIAQFRPQIAHRATQYLRELHISPESACSTILTLHLLDSLPLTDTLSTLLSQRSRTLNTLLARNLDFRSNSRPGSPISKSKGRDLIVTGLPSASPTVTAPDRTLTHQDVARDVRDAVIGLLDVIDETLRIARGIFYSNRDGSRRKSLAEQSLEDIQSDTPPESVYTTSTLLSTLPSSTHLLTLPPSILSYKPYIDLTSPSASVDPAVVDAKLLGWFEKAIDGLKGRIKVWFAGLESIREVWGLRRKVLERLLESEGLSEFEKQTVQSVFDSRVSERVAEVARVALEGLEKSLDSAMSKAVQDIRGGVEGSQLDITPSTFLFSVTSVPSLSQPPLDSSSTTTPFKSFKEALRQRVDRRTPLLNSVLSAVECKAQEIQDNLNVMNEDDEGSRRLQDQIMMIYHEVVHSSVTGICHVLERIINEELMDENNREKGQVVNVVIFVGRICYYISESSCIHNLRCRRETVQAFDETLNDLHERSLDCWRGHAVSKALTGSESMFVPLSQTSSNADFVWPSQPSSELINALLSMMSSIDSLGLSQATLINKSVTIKAMEEFIFAFATKISTEDRSWQRDTVQLLWDLTFLHQLSLVQGLSTASPSEATSALTVKLSHLQLRLPSILPEDALSKLKAHIDHSIDLYFTRSQTLLAPFIISTRLTPQKSSFANGDVAVTESAMPRPGIKPTALLPFGTPEADQDYRLAIETVKPSARFGLLPVGNSIMR